jgi:hypothetical protein
MPDYINILKEKQLEKDNALQPKVGVASIVNSEPPQLNGENTDPVQQEQPQQSQQPTQEQSIEQETNARFLEEKHSLVNEQRQQEPLPDNPYTWTPEYTQRGFVEEVGTSLARGFGKHVIGGTGDIIQLVNGVIPGWEIREGNMLSRALQDIGKDFEEEYQVYMPDEIKGNEFTIKTFMNPDFWSKTAAEYIPQLVEMIFLSKGAGALAKGGAKSLTKGIGKSMTKEALEEIGQKVVVNTSERVLGGVAKKASKVAGQSNKNWRSSFITTGGEATEGFATASETFGGGVGMNLISGLQNAGQLANEMKEAKDEDGNFLYTEEQIGQAAAYTMTENMKYLPIDMLSYGMVYAKSAGKFNQMLNPFGKKQGKKFFNSAEQMVATSKSFTKEITPIMSVLDKVKGKLGRGLERGRKVGSAVGKPLFEGLEEQFQETWEEWATKKARSRVTGEPITIDGKESDGSLNDYFSFFFSKENEATRTIAMALGVLGGAGSNIVEAVNKKAEQQYKNFSKTELMKNAATSDKAYDRQTAYIKEQLVDNAIDGNVDSVAMIDEMIETGVLPEDSKEEWHGIAKTLEEGAKTAKAIGNLNVAGQVAFLENKLRVQVAENGHTMEQTKKNEKIKALNEELKNNPKKLKEELAKVEKAWESTEAGFTQQIAAAQLGVQNIIAGQTGKAEVTNIKHVTDEDGNTVAIGLSEQDYNDYYNRTDEEVYADAKTKKIDPRPAIGKMGNALKEFYKSAAEKLGAFKNNAVDKAKDVVEKNKQKKEPQKIKPITAESIATTKARLSKDNVPFSDPELGIKIAEIAALEGDEQVKAIEDANKKIEEYNKGIDESVEGDNGGRAYKTDLDKSEDLDNAIAKAKRMMRLSGKKDKDLTSDRGVLKYQLKAEESTANNLKVKKEQRELAKQEIAKYKEALDFLDNIESEGRAYKTDDTETLTDEQKAEEKKSTKAPERTASDLDASIEATFEKPGKNNITTADNEIEKQLKDAKIDFSNEKEAKAKVQELVEAQEGRIGKIARVEGVTTDELVDYIMKIGKEGSFKPESKGEAKKRADKAKKIADLKAKLEKQRKARPEYKNAEQIQQAQIFNNPESKKEFAKAIKHDPTQKQALQEEYDAYLSSTIARAQLGPSVITNQIAVNQHLRRLYPNTKIQVYAMSNLYASIGENALGYAIGSSLMIDEKVWNQDDIFMHEFAHIHYELTKGEPATQAILKEAIKDKALVTQLYRTYESQVVYAYKQKGWKPGMKKARGIKANMTDEQLIALNKQLAESHKNGKKVAYALPFHQQPILQDELFAHYMQGPLSDQFSKFFSPRTDFSRQAKVKSWWKWIKDKAVKNESEMIDVLRTLNQGKEVPIENLKAHIMGTFIGQLQGKDVTLKGRMKLSDEEVLVMSDKNDDVLERINIEFGKKQDEEILNQIEAIDPEKIGTDTSDFDVWASQEEVDGGDMFVSDAELLTAQENGSEMDMGTFWDKGYDNTTAKNTEMITYFVAQYNREANERLEEKLKKQNEAVTEQLTEDDLEKNNLFYDENGDPVDATFYEGLNLSKFNEGLIDLAKAYSSPIDFIRVLEESKIRSQQMFIKHLNKEYTDPLSRLVTMHNLFTNSEILPAIIHQIGKDGAYTTFTPNSIQDSLAVDRTLQRVLNTDIDAIQRVSNAIEILERQERPNEYAQAIDTIINFYGPETSLSQKVADSGYLILDKKNQTHFQAFKQLIERGLSKDSVQDPDSAISIISAINNTSKLYSSTSVVVGPTGNNATTRMFSNHSIKLFNKMKVALKGSEDNAEAKADFINEFSNSIEPISSGFNPLLESFWNNFHETGELPMLVLDLGSKNELYDKSKNYKDASAEQQLLNEMLQFNESKREGNKNYLASMDILGDSSRRVLSSLPRIDNSFNPDGTFKASHISKMFKIYNKMSYNKKALVDSEIFQKTPANYKQFEKAIYEAADQWNEYLIENIETLSKISQFVPFYKTDSNGNLMRKLSIEGELMVKDFTFNRIANTFYTHEILSPGLLLDTLTKYHKGQIAPVIALDPDLQVEMIPMADEFRIPAPLEGDFNSRAEYKKAKDDWKKTAIITNDGIQYILEEHAEAIRQTNPDFNRGYKLYSHSIEKSNPYFMNQTSQMKGYTTILTEEAVTTGGQQHLYPIWKIMNDRNVKFKQWYKETYKEDYDPMFRTKTSIKESRPKYIPIIVPVSADKSSLFAIQELNGFQNKFSLEQLKNPEVLEEYKALLDKIYYPTSRGAQFTGLDGSNFGPQQIMDKRYDKATLSIQAITSIPFAQEGENLLSALKIQDYISNQKWINLKTKVLDEINDKDDFSYSEFIVKTANALNSDPYTIRALTNGEKPYSPHVASFALNQFRAQMIRHGNNLSVPGTYGQTISDMGYKYVTDENVEAFTNKPNRDKIFPKIKEEYINGNSGLNFYGAEVIEKFINGRSVKTTRTKPMEVILPKKQKGDKTIERQSFYSVNDGGALKARNYLTAVFERGKRKGQYRQIVTLRRLNLVDSNDKIIPGAISNLIETNSIYSSKDSTPENRIGTYIPGETVIMTRIPHNGPAFVGIGEVVGYHDTGASNIIVPAEYTTIIGADHDGDALFVYKQAKLANGQIDERMGDTVTTAGYGNWNKAFDGIVDQWLSHNMRQTLEVPLNFESETNKAIEENDRQLNPKKYVKIDKLKEQFNNKQITEAEYDQQLAEIRADEDFIMPFSPSHYKQQYNNSVIAKQTIGVAFNTHRAINMLATYQTRLSNGFRINAQGKEVPNLTSISINNKTFSKFHDTPTPNRVGENSRIHRSTVLANIVLDSTKNGHADAMNLNLNSISSAMILVNLGFDLKEIGLLLNHPAAKEYISKRNDIGNDYIDNGSYSKLIYDYSKNKDIQIYSSPNEFDVNVQPLNPNGTKNPYYESKENNGQVIRLMHYLSKISDDISVITNVTNGHNKLENNPFALEKQIKDLEALLNNNKRDSVDSKKKDQTLYFNDENSAVNINQSAEINNYKKVAKEYIEHQKRLNITNNQKVRELFEMIKTQISSEELTGKQLIHYTEKVMPFIYARLLGANNIGIQDVNEIFAFDHLPLANELHAYEQELDEIVYYQDSKNVLNKDTEKTRSKLFRRGIIYNGNRIKLNPQVLQKHFSDKDVTAIKQDFANLPLKLQRKLVLYDLIKNGWQGEESLYPIFPYDITSFITDRATEFQNSPDSEKIPANIIKDAFKTILDIETINPDANYLPKVYLDNKPQFDLKPNSPANNELYAELGKNKKVLNRILGTQPFRLTVYYQEGGIRRSHVVQINPLGNIINAEDRMLTGESNATDKQIARNKATDSWNKMKRSLIKSKTEAGHVLFEDANKHIFKDKNGNKKETLVDAIYKQNPNVLMVMIPDPTTKPPGHRLLPIMDNELIKKEEAQRAESKKKINNSGVGRFFKSDYNNYTNDEPLTQEQLVNAYEYKRTLSRRQESELWLNYIQDKNDSNEDKENWIDPYGKLLEINPRTDKPFTEDELIAGYEKWGAKDAYAAANITVPIMLELIQRESHYQTEHFTKVMEGENDIPVMKAWLQTNNIDSTHPATQAIQREIETEFKYFMNERKQYLSRINKVTEDLYAEKLGYNPVKTGFLKKIQLATKLLFKNRANIYQKLYGNILLPQTEKRLKNGEVQKRFALLPQAELTAKLNSGQISQAEYNFATTFREITKELDPAKHDSDFINGGIPNIGPNRLEAFGRKGMLGVLTTSRPSNQAIYDVRLEWNGGTVTFKTIEDNFKQDLKSNWKNNIEYIKLRRKAAKLLKERKNEDGSKFQHSDVFSHTLLGDGMVNNFANGGWANENDLLSMDLSKALSDFAHTQLFISGNENFAGFKPLQAKVDGLLLHNQMKGFTNQNKFVREVYKEYFLKAKKLNPDSSTDKVVNAMVKGNLLYIMGWKLLVVGKGLYVIGNIMAGKYNNIKNHGGATWLRGERRYWGVSGTGFKNRKAVGVLKNLNFMDINLYDDVNVSQASGLDKIFTDIALMPMQMSEKWIQGAHFLGLLTEEQWNLFDDNGNYKTGATQILPEQLIGIENAVKNSHGKGYSPVDQRMIQRYSWGKAMMQFSRFIPTMFYDRFAKEDINIYGQKHIGSLRAVWEPVAKFISGEIPASELKGYRDSLDAQSRARFDSGLRGMGITMAAIMAGQLFGWDPANELAGDANYLINTEKLEYKAFPSVFRTTKDMVSVFVPN